MVYIGLTGVLKWFWSVMLGTGLAVMLGNGLAVMLGNGLKMG